MNYFNYIPSQLIGIICTFLDSKQVYKDLYLLSKDWSNILIFNGDIRTYYAANIDLSHNRFIAKAIYTSWFDQLIVKILIKSNFLYLSELKIRYFETVNMISDADDLKALYSTYLPNLKSLVFGYRYTGEYYGLSNLFSDPNAHDLIMKNLPKSLIKLKIIGIFGLSHNSEMQVNNFPLQLKYIELDNVYVEFDNGYKGIISWPGSLETLIFKTLKEGILIEMPSNKNFVNLTYEANFVEEQKFPDTLTSMKLIFLPPNIPAYTYYGARILRKLPPCLKILELSNCGLDIKKLPTTLIDIEINQGSIFNVEKMHKNLTSLKCIDTHMKDKLILGGVNSPLIYLECEKAGLKQIITNNKAFPDKLITLNCGTNQLDILQELPLGLQTLNCEHNRLKKLPQLPQNLKRLNFSFNPKITDVIQFPNSITHLSFTSDSNIMYLPINLRFLAKKTIAKDDSFDHTIKNVPRTVNLYNKLLDVFANLKNDQIGCRKKAFKYFNANEFYNKILFYNELNEMKLIKLIIEKFCCCNM